MEDLRTELESVKALLSEERTPEDAIINALAAWAKVIQKGDDLLEVVAGVAEMAAKLPDVPADGARRAVSDVRSAANKALSVVNSVYGSFAEGRQSLYEAAKVWGLSTSRSGGGGKKGKGAPLASRSDADLADDLVRIAGSSLPKDSLELGSKALAVLRAEGKKGFPAESRQTVVEAGLNFRDAVSSGWFMWTASVTRRVEELANRINEKEKWESTGTGKFSFKLPWDDDPEIGDSVSE